LEASIETVSILLGHQSSKVTEKHYNPWVKTRQEALDKAVLSASPVKTIVQKWYNFQEFDKIRRKKWRERVEVESTIRPAKGRIAGFEGREGHRTPFAPVFIIHSNRVS